MQHTEYTLLVGGRRPWQSFNVGLPSSTPLWSSSSHYQASIMEQHPKAGKTPPPS
ncbi:hypothetical protein GW17_00029750, partial [Ensete ventricosum]